MTAIDSHLPSSDSLEIGSFSICPHYASGRIVDACSMNSILMYLSDFFELLYSVGGGIGSLGHAARPVAGSVVGFSTPSSLLICVHLLNYAGWMIAKSWLAVINERPKVYCVFSYLT